MNITKESFDVLKEFVNEYEMELNKIYSEKLFIERDQWFLSILKDLKIGEIVPNTSVTYYNSKNEWIFKDSIEDQVLKNLNWKINVTMSTK
jgi:hypothetical protein